MKSNETNLPDEQISEEPRPRKKRNRWKTVSRVVDRIFGFFLAAVIMAGVAALGVGYILTRDEYPSLRDTFVVTMDETRRFRFIPRVYLSGDDCYDILARSNTHLDEVMDPSLIHIASQDPQQSTAEPEQGSEAPQSDPYGYVDEDGDGYILVDVSGPGYNGYMLIVLDPTRCFVAQGGPYQTINAIAERTGAIGGINGGAFIDNNGAGNGGQPEGLTYIDGVMVESARYERESFAGFDAQGILHVGYFNADDCNALGIVCGVTFSPPLIINGVPQSTYLVSGVNPRSAIGQRADGAVLMLAIDGRQLSSAGATYADVIDVMLQFGAVNAMNLDGGSSTVMYLNGELVNSPSSQSGYSRGLPNAFLFR